ncbi:uncharacterized protein METZ01_LOCUS126348 [marine metagenome]|uniref:Uncharacterized protein n=1 Tax=marine metagenome TaxID=408172 RepID=A0A381Y912_9ZZZZ
MTHLRIRKKLFGNASINGGVVRTKQNKNALNLLSRLLCIQLPSFMEYSTFPFLIRSTEAREWMLSKPGMAVTDLR